MVVVITWTNARGERHVFPAGLAALARRLARGDRDADPIELPWQRVHPA